MNRRNQIEETISDRFAVLQEHLEQQRRQEWTDYGHALKANLETAAAAIEDLAVPIDIRIDIATYRTDRPYEPDVWGLQDQLLEQAAGATPTPEQLPGAPFQRLGPA